MVFAKVYRYVPILAAVAGLGLSAPASRADEPRFRFGLHIGEGFGLVIHHSDRERRRCIPGYYEERTERILVEPEHCERRWAPAIYETRHHGRHGRGYEVCVHEGYWEEYTVPARYECRTVRVWVPERWVRD